MLADIFAFTQKFRAKKRKLERSYQQKQEKIKDSKNVDHILAKLKEDAGNDLKALAQQFFANIIKHQQSFVDPELHNHKSYRVYLVFALCILQHSTASIESLRRAMHELAECSGLSPIALIKGVVPFCDQLHFGLSVEQATHILQRSLEICSMVPELKVLQPEINDVILGIRFKQPRPPAILTAYKRSSSSGSPKKTGSPGGTRYWVKRAPGKKW